MPRCWPPRKRRNAAASTGCTALTISPRPRGSSTAMPPRRGRRCAGLARETSRIRLGTLITPLTFREPALLSKMASTVAEMSGGRVEVSIGTGWNTGEHEALGLEFESLGVRFERLEEYAKVLIGFWGDERYLIRGHVLQRLGYPAASASPTAGLASSSAVTAGARPRCSQRATPTSTTSTGHRLSSAASSSGVSMVPASRWAASQAPSSVPSCSGSSSGRPRRRSAEWCLQA